MDVEFKAWPKIERIKGAPIVTITEKIDGTNSCVIIQDGKLVGVQSRTRMIKPGDDNFGFAFWVYDNEEELSRILGDGYHYGEWYGEGIQKNPHKITGRRFALFNVGRQYPEGFDTTELPVKTVPHLYTGPWYETVVENHMNAVRFVAEDEGYEPEGIIVYWHQTRSYSKATFRSPEGKWAA